MSTQESDLEMAGMTSELERAAVCDIVKKQVDEEVQIETAADFWACAASQLGDRGFPRTARQVEIIFNYCRDRRESLPNANRYIDSSARKTDRKKKAEQKHAVYPPEAPDPMATRGETFDSRGYQNLTAQELQAFAIAGLAQMEEKTQEQKAAEKKNPKWDMSSR